MAQYKYVMDNTWHAARERLALLETIWDPWTIRNLEKVGVEAGWRCLEVGGGGGSMAAWLCRRVGSTGHVMATDLEPRFLEGIEAHNLEARRHDILVDPFPEATFDLVHARALLTFLPQAKDAIRKMVKALKPDGWLLLEEPDYVSAIPDPSMSPESIALSRKVWDACFSYLKSGGYDTEFGRHLYHDLASYGLTDLQAEGFVAMQLGGTPTSRFWRVTFEQIQDQVVAHGLLTSTEFKDYQMLLESRDYRWLQPTMMSVWGRLKPA